MSDSRIRDVVIVGGGLGRSGLGGEALLLGVILLDHGGVTAGVAVTVFLTQLIEQLQLGFAIRDMADQVAEVPKAFEPQGTLPSILPPLIQVTSVTYWDSTFTRQTLDPATYQIGRAHV